MEDEIIKEFLIESYENLDLLDQELLALETDPHNQERLASIFRTVHTLKGTSGFLGLSILESVTHVGESLLSRLRDGELELNAPRTSLLLRLLDAVRAILANVEATGSEGDETYGPLVEKLRMAADGMEVEVMAPSAPKPAVAVEIAPMSRRTPTKAPEPSLPPIVSRAPRDTDQPPPSTMSAEKPAQKPDAKRDTDPPRSTAPDRSVAPKAPAADTAMGVSETTVRVDVGLLDTLMNLVGELVLARNQILQHAQSQDDHAFVSTTQRLNLITTELQEGVMKTRMQPIASVWNKFPRVVRDLAMTCSKEIVIHMEGKETELDRTIIAAIKDPLTHVIRNSVDHGIESPEKREALGKPRVGNIWARAYHEGGQVNIEISDDGGGIDPRKVADKALRRGIITKQQAESMSDNELAALVFRPGFSTAQEVSAISGRGVGMDVVKTNIEKIGGAVELYNRPGKGLTLRIKIPLTLAIIPALVIATGGEQFAIPQVNLLELVRLEGEQARHAVEHIHGTPVYRLRGNLLALTYLNDELGVKGQGEDGVLNIVVLQADDCTFGLVVDAVNDTEEIVVKPLGRELSDLDVYAGTTIMGDGHVALILDVMGLARRAGIAGANGAADLLQSSDAAAKGPDNDQQALLLVRSGESGQLAIPLSAVARLEELPRDAIERASGLDVMQYRGAIMPLVHVSHALGLGSYDNDDDLLQIVVYSHGERRIGIVVDQILDIASEIVSFENVAHRHGILGAAVVSGKVTDIVDMRALIETIDPTFFDGVAA